MHRYYHTHSFSPAFFASTMGLGQAAAVLHNFPFNARWLEILGIVVWGITIAQFVLFNVLFITRFVKYPGQFKKMLLHPGQSAFLGCYPMGMATIISMAFYIFLSDAKDGSHRGWIAVYVLWWINVVISLLCTWVVVYVMMAKHTRPSESLNATILLPIVTVVVAAAVGGTILPCLPHTLQPATVIVSFLLWANGQAMAFACITIYIFRLYIHNLPPPQITFSSLLPIGPLGQGGFGIICMADGFAAILKRENQPHVADVVEWGGILIAMFLLGYAIFWIVFVLMSAVMRFPKSFNFSFWATTFPLGTVVVSLYKIGDKLQMTSIRAIGAVLGVVLCLNVIICGIFTIQHTMFDDQLLCQARAETWSDEDLLMSSAS